MTIIPSVNRSTAHFFGRLIMAFTLLFASINAVPACGQEPESLQALAEDVELFNGKDLTGWLFFTNDDEVQQDAVWSVVDGVLKCTGKPAGYLQTKRWYRDYELILQWRWPGERGGNSGVLVHTTTPLLFYGWPKSMEVQLQAGNAGDFWVIGTGVDVRVEDESNRRPQPKPGNQHSHRRIKRLKNDATETVEKPVGEWNTMKVICDDNEIKVFVNDVLVNHGTEMTVTEGAIALQSEGRPIEFKNINVSVLK